MKLKDKFGKKKNYFNSMASCICVNTHIKIMGVHFLASKERTEEKRYLTNFFIQGH